MISRKPLPLGPDLITNEDFAHSLSASEHGHSDSYQPNTHAIRQIKQFVAEPPRALFSRAGHQTKATDGAALCFHGARNAHGTVR